MASNQDALTPSPAILAKLGSIAIHAREMLSADGHAFDRIALVNLLAQDDVIFWLEQMHAMALIPRERRPKQAACSHCNASPCRCFNPEVMEE
jgi:hypothetical protein